MSETWVTKQLLPENLITDYCLLIIDELIHLRALTDKRNLMIPYLFSISEQTIHHAHHSQFLGGRGFHAFHRQVKEER